MCKHIRKHFNSPPHWGRVYISCSNFCSVSINVSTEFESTAGCNILTAGCVNSGRERLMVSREHITDLMDTVMSRKAALVVLCGNTD